MRIVRAVISLVDPASPDFVRRWVRIAGFLAVIALIAGVIASVALLRSPFGRYMRAVFNMEFFDRDAAAEQTLRTLVAEGNPERFAVYNALAGALIDQGRSDEALHVLDAAVEKFPSDYRAHGSRCSVGIRVNQAAHVLDSCDRAVELAPDDGRYFERRAAALAATGDLEGSAEDVRLLVAQCGGAGANGSSRRCVRYAEWLGELEAGANPFVDGVRIR